jgi:hypothetical protein
VTIAVYAHSANGLIVLHFAVSTATEGVTVLNNWRARDTDAVGADARVISGPGCQLRRRKVATLPIS